MTWLKVHVANYRLDKSIEIYNHCATFIEPLFFYSSIVCLWYMFKLLILMFQNFDDSFIHKICFYVVDIMVL